MKLIVTFVLLVLLVLSGCSRPNPEGTCASHNLTMATDQWINSYHPLSGTVECSTPDEQIVTYKVQYD